MPAVAGSARTLLAEQLGRDGLAASPAVASAPPAAPPTERGLQGEAERELQPLLPALPACSVWGRGRTTGG